MQGVGPGSVLGGRYTLRSRLAQSPSIERWTAEDTTLSRPVTVLCVSGLHPNAPAALDAARRAAGIDDPRLVRVHDVGTTEGHTSVSYVVEESLGDARSLTELLGGGGLPAELVRRIVGEAATGLEAARQRGLHHLHLTPASLWVGSNGDVHLQGVATLGALSGADSLNSAVASRMDTVGLLACAYAGLTGRWPLESRVSGLAAAPKVVGGVPAPSELAAGVPGDLDALCRLTLTRNSGPITPGDLATQIAPWSSVRPPADVTSLAVATPDTASETAPAADPAPAAAASTRTEPTAVVLDPSVEHPSDDDETTAIPVAPAAGSTAAAAGAVSAPVPAVPPLAVAGVAGVAAAAEAADVPAASTYARAEATPRPTDEPPPSRPATDAVAPTEPVTVTPSSPLNSPVDPDPDAAPPTEPVAAPKPAAASTDTQALPVARPAPAAPSAHRPSDDRSTGGADADPEGSAGPQRPEVPAAVAVAAANAGKAIGAAAATTASAAGAASTAVIGQVGRWGQATRARVEQAREQSRTDDAATSAGSAAGVAGRTSTSTTELEPPLPLLPASTAYAPSRQQSRIVMTIMGILVVVALLIGWSGVKQIGANSGDLFGFGDPPVPEVTVTAPTQTQAPNGQSLGAAVDLVSATGFDPEGDNSENNDQAARVIDGDASTAWQSEGYNAMNFGGLKDGVGVAVDLGSAREVTVVTLTLPTASSGTLYLGPTAQVGGNAKAIGTWEGKTGTVRITTNGGVSGRFLTIWFTEPSSDGRGRFRATLSEVAVTAR